MSTHKELAQIIGAFRPQRFLEIGVQFGGNLLAVDCSCKVGIEPLREFRADFPHKIYKGTSDTVFSSLDFQKEDDFDLIFIDGMHEFKQVVRDVKNSLKFLAREGFIICHDVYPFDLLSKYENLTSKKYPGDGIAWTGDVWKLIFYARFCMLQLDFCTIRNFPGYLCLWRNTVSREPYDPDFSIDTIDAFSLEYGMKNVGEMNIISLEEFITNVK